jgi:hypothetical protein
MRERAWARQSLERDRTLRAAEGQSLLARLKAWLGI